MPSPSDPPADENGGLVARREATALNIRVNPDLAARFAAVCQQEDVTQRAALHEALCCWLSERDALPDGYTW